MVPKGTAPDDLSFHKKRSTTRNTENVKPGYATAHMIVVRFQSTPLKNLYNRAVTKPAAPPRRTYAKSSNCTSVPRWFGATKPRPAIARVHTHDPSICIPDPTATANIRQFGGARKTSAWHSFHPVSSAT